MLGTGALQAHAMPQAHFCPGLGAPASTPRDQHLPRMHRHLLIHWPRRCLANSSWQQQQQQQQQQRQPHLASWVRAGAGAKQQTTQQDQEVPAPSSGGPAEAVPSAQPTPARPKKLERFSSGAAREYRLAIQNFHYQEEVSGGTLLVRPLSPDSLPEVSELLTEVFAASDDRIGLYTRYMRGQIKSYLTNHLRLVPDAVVLVATLRATPASPGAPDAPSDPPLTSSGAAAGCTDCSSRDAEASNDSSISSISSGGSSIGGSDGENPLSLGGLATRNSAAVLRQPGQARRSASTTLAWPGEEEQLVGTAEVAFTEDTRTKFLTLNPPKDSAYLGNMAVVPNFRQRGYGRALLAAAERLTRLAAFPTVYLHLRFKDTGAAPLYERAGFREVKRDMWLLPLIGYERRFLMAKDLPRTPQ